MNRLLPVADTRYRVLATLLAVALLLSGALNCFLLSRTDGLTAYPTLLADDDADDLSATRAELTLTQTMLARCQAASLRRDSSNLAAHPPGH